MIELIHAQCTMRRVNELTKIAEGCIMTHINTYNPTLKNDTFFEMIRIFREHLIKFSERGVAGAVDSAMNTMCIDARCDDNVFYTYHTMIAFYNTWQNIVCELHDTLFDVVEGMSDDSYRDLINMLPIVGERLISKIINGDYTNLGYDTLMVDIKYTGKMSNFDAELHVINSEYYPTMSLFDRLVVPVAHVNI